MVGENELWKKYWTYANVQRAFDQAIMSRTTDRNVRLSVSVKAFPFPAYATNLGSTFAAVFFGLAFVFAFAHRRRRRSERRRGARAARSGNPMRIMGLSERAYWASWFVTSYAPLLLVSFLVAAAGAFPFRHTDWTDTCPVSRLLWTAQLVAFCFALVPLFASSAVAAVGSALVYVLTWIPGVAAVASEPMGSSADVLCAMMPRTASTSGDGSSPSSKTRKRARGGIPSAITSSTGASTRGRRSETSRGASSCASSRRTARRTPSSRGFSTEPKCREHFRGFCVAKRAAPARAEDSSRTPPRTMRLRYPAAWSPTPPSGSPRRFAREISWSRSGASPR